jgi:REP element-mobilizing transposase RayT
MGGYYVTICTFKRACTLGDVVDGAVCLSEWGKIVEEEWLQTEVVRPYVTLDEYVVMPNHLHGILMLKGGNRDAEADNTSSTIQTPGHDSVVSLHEVEDEIGKEEFGRPSCGSLHAVMRSFKAAVTRRIRDMEKDRSLIVWQGRFHEHVIRHEADLARIREYIVNNPARWNEDENNPAGWL